MEKQLRESGIPVIGDVPWGTHFCQFYQTKDDLIDILVPYFKAGLENNEFCMWVTSEPLRVEDARRALKEVVKNLDTYIKKGQVEILDAGQWYTKSGRFDCNEVLQGWVEKEKQALRNGFDGLRLTGNTFWLEKRDWKDFADYEAAVNSVIRQQRMIAVCSYCLDKCSASEVIDVVSNHQFAIIRQEGEWRLIESSEHKRAEEEIRNLAKFPSENPDPIFRVAADGTLLYANAAGQPLLADWNCRVGQLVPEHWRRVIEEVFSSGARRRVEEEHAGRVLSFDVVPIAEAGYVNLYGRDITERKKAEEALQHSEEYFRALTENSSDIIIIVDKKGTITYASPSIERFSGYKPEELTGKSGFQFIHSDDLPRAIYDFSKAILTKEAAISNSFRMRHKDGSERIFEGLGKNSLDNPIIAGFVMNLRDITERKKAEQKIKLFSDAVASAFDCFMLPDIKGNFTYANEAACTTFGYTPEEFLKLNITKLDADPEVAQKITQEVGTKGKWSGEVINIRKNGEKFPSFLSAFIIKDDKGNQKGTMGILRDITERKRAEEALRLSHRFLVIANRHTEMLPLLKEFVGEIRNYTGCAAVGIRLLDEEGNIPYQAYEGFSERFYELESPLSIKSDRCMCINVIKGETDPKLPFYTEGGSFCMNGTTRFLATVSEEEKGHTRNTCDEFGYESVALIPLRLDERLLGLIHVADPRENMVPLQMVRMLEDAAMELGAAIERLKAQEALAAEKERLDVTLRSIGDGVIVADTGGKVVLMNQVAEQLTGWTFEEAAGRPLADVFHIINEDTRERCENPVEKVLRIGRIAGLANRTVLVSKNGTERFIADSGAPIRDDEGDAIGVILVFRDMTERRRAEQELLRAEKMESVGVLAGGIAHDFNNILTLILGNISLAKTVTDAESKTFELLSHAEKACWRARDLTQQLLTFSKGGAPVRKTITLSSIIRDATAFALSGSKVRCDFSIPEDLWPVEADEGQIGQVINNLVINADQAMPGGGLIRISAENVGLSPESGLPLPPGKYVKLAVRDQGIGISKEHLPKIFDPYFTTKQKGSGLGLATAYSVVKSHDGHIAVESQLGVGSTFFIYLPASEKEIQRQETFKERIIVGQGRVLVMDDEEAIRQLARDILTRCGYQVVIAKDGAEAIELFKKAKKSRRPFHAVILDLTVPGGMGGKETIEKLLAIDRNVKAIVSSGYSNDPIMADFGEYGFRDVVAKPYDIRELAAIVHHVISGEPGNSATL